MAQLIWREFLRTAERAAVTPDTVIESMRIHPDLTVDLTVVHPNGARVSFSIMGGAILATSS